MVRQSFASLKVMAATAALLGSSAVLADGAEAASRANFNMVRTAGLDAGCAASAAARVSVQSLGFAEKMTVTVWGLPPGTELDLFTIQVPNLPFGLGWYVGDLKIGPTGTATKTFISRFSVETFAVAIGEAPAPTPHRGKDAGKNPAFKPVHTFHLGLWFNSPAEAKRAGCPGFTTPFNGDHTAGVQVLNTGNFPDKQGPLRQID